MGGLIVILCFLLIATGIRIFIDKSGKNLDNGKKKINFEEKQDWNRSKDK